MFEQIYEAGPIEYKFISRSIFIVNSITLLVILAFYLLFWGINKKSMKMYSVKKVPLLFSYLVVLYYLLPYSPIALYYNSHQNKNNISISANEKRGSHLHHQPMVKNAGLSIQKEKNRFDLGDFYLNVSSDEKPKVACSDILFQYTSVYSKRSSWYTPGRSPPVI